MTFEFVREDVLRNVHTRLIEGYGGLAGVRDLNGLASAIARPRNLQEYGGADSVAALGGALVWAILRNHPFADGNKRAAFAALIIFLEINGHRLLCSEVEETALILRAAGSEITEEDLVDWLKSLIQPKETARKEAIIDLLPDA